MVPVKQLVAAGFFYDVFQLPLSEEAMTEYMFVANMTPFAISLSLILVIHDNMINGTNHIV
jgi:hypothetical protein